MVSFIEQLIQIISNMGWREWLITMLTAIIVFLGYLTYRLDERGELIVLFERELVSNQSIDECLLRVERDNHLLYRSVYLPAIVQNFPDFGEFRIEFWEPDNRNLSSENADQLKILFNNECIVLDVIAERLKEKFRDLVDPEIIRLLERID